MTTIKIGSRVITRDGFEEPFIIAEAGVNHEGDMEKARLMIKQAAEAGADAIKFQTYKAELITSKHSPAYWDRNKEPTSSQYELFKKYDKFWKKEYEELAKIAEEEGIIFLSTPFDYESADFLEPLMPAYKVASADITNLPFLRHIARKGKPILLSTGASTVSEIWKAIETITEEGNDQIVLLHCSLIYPTSLEKANLGMIKDMYNKFPEYIIGYSDHTLSEHVLDVLPVAWLLGAKVIEKHFTFDKTLPGNDHYHAMDKEDLKKLRAKISYLREMIGSLKKGYTDEELCARKFARRSLVARRDIKKDQIITEEDIIIKRPGTGIPPYLIDFVIGSIATRDIFEDEIIGFGDFRRPGQE